MTSAIAPSLRWTWCKACLNALTTPPFFRPRGIWDPDVRNRYERWEAYDSTPVRRAYEPHLTPSGVRRKVSEARQSDGLIMHRVPPPDMDLAPIPPEIRPDKAVVTKIRWHFHPTVSSVTAPVHPRTGNLIPPKDISTAKAMAKHIARAKAPDDHYGVNNEEVHAHRDTAKYLFPKTPSIDGKPWTHDHTEYDDPETLARHVRKRH